MAEGYQVNSLSAKQIGMGHTGVAQNLGAESMFFNPGALGFMEETLDLAGSFTAIMPTAYATHNGIEYKTDMSISTPIGVHAAFAIYDNLKAGVSFYTPYGSNIDWTENWPGAVLNQSVSLKVFTIQPTVSWKIIPKLSVGLGFMVTWGGVDLNKAILSGASFDALAGSMGLNIPAFGNTTPASINLNGNADVTLGFNIGAMYEINSKWNVGASFRTKMNMKVGAGKASVTYANEIARAILESKVGLLNEANFKASMPAPWVLSLGTAYKPIEKLTLALDARLTGWSAYKTLDIEFLSEQLTGFNQHITKDYKNAWCFSLGGQYAVTDRCDLRLGLMIDTTPVNNQYYNPETPGMTKIEPTCGVSFRPIKGLSIDFGFMYIHGCGKKGVTGEYDNVLTNSTSKFTADYKLHSYAPALGLSYSF
ncbi:MAG: outer membrane protein transport protein [Lachnoclostridium sp.]|nr:outer membrane protein transport protein [Lachnoclostridium sp.]